MRQRRGARHGLTLIEVMIAMVILGGVVIAMGMGTTNFQRTITSSAMRSRAQSVADMQIGRARAWPTYSTLSQLATARYNGTADGLVSTTLVTPDSAGGAKTTTVKVTVTSSQTGLLANSIVRSVIIAAP